MSRLDDELEKALRREEPPEGFADRVLARIQVSPLEASRAAGKGWWTRFRKTLGAFSQDWNPGRLVTAGALVVALLLLSIGIGIYRHRQQEMQRQEAERAKAQVMLALQIASEKLNVAQKRVLENNDRLAGDGSNGGLRKENQ